ncbi:MAG TPA: hypothetical protein VE999_02160 [Gemmataceae bacterium]|nr:hypothetical protein [Gemmataceae bacterium]
MATASSTPYTVSGIHPETGNSMGKVALRWRRRSGGRRTAGDWLPQRHHSAVRLEDSIVAKELKATYARRRRGAGDYRGGAEASDE